MDRRKFLTTTVLAGALVLTGCGVTGGGPPTADQWKPLLRLAVSLGTDRVLVANPALVPAAIRALTITADVLDRGVFTSTAEVEALLRQHIPWGQFDSSTRVLVENLIVVISEEIRVVAQQYQLPEDRKLMLLGEVIVWAKDVALRHGAQRVKNPKMSLATGKLYAARIA